MSSEFFFGTLNNVETTGKRFAPVLLCVCVYIVYAPSLISFNLLAGRLRPHARFECAWRQMPRLRRRWQHLQYDNRIIQYARFAARFVCCNFRVTDLECIFFFSILGYNDILLIPAGATNIVVEEVAPSNNYLGN